MIINMKHFPYSKLIYQLGFGTESTSKVPMKFNSKNNKCLKYIIDNAINNNFIFFQDLCKTAVIMQNDIDKFNKK